MKLVIALVMALSASSAMALSKRSTWAQIFASDATLIFEENLGGLSLDNACLTSNEVKSIRATRHCTNLVPVEHREGDNTWTDWVCERWVVSQVSYPRTTNKTVCLEYGYQDDNMICTEYGEQAVTVGNTINVSVVEEHGDHSTWPGFTKPYTFPACQ
jgi:hypothetical protein